ncbi:hypothetical protein A2U01_0072851, partial [Trifolium medium]|nr:hypothetical protein [Trifolium medium]
TGNVESHVEASVKTAIKPYVGSSGNASSEIEKTESEQVVKETLISDYHKLGETLDVSRTNTDVTLEQLSIPLFVPVAAADKATSETVNESVKEKTTTS